MARWSLYLAPWLIWTAHFLGLYMLWSLEDLLGGPPAAWRAGAVVLGGLCLIGCVAGTVLIWRRRGETGQGEGGRMMSDMAATGGVIAALAVVFQTLPAGFV